MRSRWMFLLPLAAALLATGPAAAHDGDHHWRDWLNCEKLRDTSVRHCSTAKSEWKATGQPIVVNSSPNGGVVVVGWERDVVHVEAVIHARGRDQGAADALAKKIDVTMATSGITAVGPDTDAWSVTFIVHVPRRSDLDLRAYNGPVEVDGVTGSMDLATKNGPISIENAGGDVRATSTNGPLHVTLAGLGWTGKGLVAETHNGPVQLRIPDRYSALLTSGTRNGPMDIQIPVRVSEGRYFTTELGSGGKPLRVVTRNGPISIRRI